MSSRIVTTLLQTFAIVLFLPSITAADDGKEPVVKGKPLSEWIKQLEDKDAKQRQAALGVIATLRTAAKPATAAVVLVLEEDTETDLRRRAADVLAAIGPIGREDSGPAVVKALGDKDGAVRKAAASALSNVRPRNIALVPGIVAGLESAEGEARGQLAYALGGFAPVGTGAIEPLVALLGDKEFGARANASAGLRRFGAAALPKLIKALEHENDTVVREAARTLERFGPDAALAAPTLGKLIRDAKPGAREAATALRHIGSGGKAAIPDLLVALQSKNDLLAIAAAEALSGVVGPDTKAGDVKALAAVVKDGNPVRRAAIAEALGWIGPNAAPAVENLVASLNNKEVKEAEAPGVRRNAARAIGRIGPRAKAAIPDLVKALGDPEVADAAADGLAGIGSDAVPELIKLLGGQNTRPALDALERMGPAAKKAVDATIPLLKNADTARDAARALGRIGPDAKAAVTPLRELANGKDRDLSVAAAVALVGIAPNNPAAAKDAEAAFTQALEKLGEDSVNNTAVTQLRAKAVPHLRKALKSDNPDVQRWAARELGKLGLSAADAVPDLIAALGGPNRHDAAVALGDIGPDAKDAAPALLKGLTDAKPEYRAAAAIAAARVAAPKEVLPVLIALAADPNRLRYDPDRLAKALTCFRGDPLAQAALPDLLDLYFSSTLNKPSAELAAAIHALSLDLAKKALIPLPK